MARVSSPYLVEAIYHYFFSRCLANVRGIRTVSPSICNGRDRSTRPRSALIWLSSSVPSDSSRLSRIFSMDGHSTSDKEQWSAITNCSRNRSTSRKNSEFANRSCRQFVHQLKSEISCFESNDVFIYKMSQQIQ